MSTTVPARNAPKSDWADWLEDHDIDVPAGATRADMIALWALNKEAPVDVENPDGLTDAEERSAQLILGTDNRPAPNPALAEQVAPEFAFSTDSGTRKEPDKLLISLDGIACYLYEPSKTLMILMASSFSPGGDPLEKVRAMLNLVNASLDGQGRMILHRMMTAGDGSFDDALPGKLAWTILNQWAPTLAADADLETEKAPPQNRAARRKAARK